MSELSPAAQAVLDAANASATNAWSDATHQRFRTGVADALRAAADQLDHPTSAHTLYAFADELEQLDD
jgi:hypothetical protein